MSAEWCWASAAKLVSMTLALVRKEGGGCRVTWGMCDECGTMVLGECRGETSAWRRQGG